MHCVVQSNRTCSKTYTIDRRPTSKPNTRAQIPYTASVRWRMLWITVRLDVRVQTEAAARSARTYLPSIMPVYRAAVILIRRRPRINAVIIVICGEYRVGKKVDKKKKKIARASLLSSFNRSGRPYTYKTRARVYIRFTTGH